MTDTISETQSGAKEPRSDSVDAERAMREAETERSEAFSLRLAKEARDFQQRADMDKATRDSDAKSLDRLFEYTKFHIGAYLTLAAAFIAAANIKVRIPSGPPSNSPGAVAALEAVLEVNPALAVATVICFVVAGIAGGVIASSISQQSGGNSDAFLKSPIGPWNVKFLRMKGYWWTYLEHTSFWIGLGAAALAVGVPRCAIWTSTTGWRWLPETCRAVQSWPV